MRKRILLLLIGCCTALWVSCSERQATGPESPQGGDPGELGKAEAIAREVAALSGWGVTEPEASGTVDPTYRVLGFSREVIIGDVAHYEYEVRIGPGPYDVMRLHRVVRERRPGRPIRTEKAVFLQHGDVVGFEGVFLFGARSATMPDDHAAAVFLAESDVDAWGIDQPWILVPEEETSFLFMADWGMDFQLQNLRLGLAIARLTRALTGSGFGRMPLLGYSSGAVTGYAYVSYEAGRPAALRHVNGFIPVDYAPKTDVPEWATAWCDFATWSYDQIANGVYEYYYPFKPLGQLARTDPDGDSPFLPGFTNLQAALYFGAAVIYPPPPWFHYVGGDLDESGMPLDLHFTQVAAWLDFLETASPYEPNLFQGDYSALVCEQTDVPWDDNFGLVEVPVLYLAARGGAGEFGLYATTLLGSGDVTTLVVEQVDPIEEDIGHIDIWTADGAAALFWQPVLDWLEDHTDREAGVLVAEDSE